jgi:hypothetical protein
MPAAAAWPPGAAVAAQAADDELRSLRSEAGSPECRSPPRGSSSNGFNSSRAPTPAPVKAADAEVARTFADAAAAAAAAGAAPSSPSARAAPTPHGFRAVSAAGGPLPAPQPDGGALSYDDSDTDAHTFRRERDALLLRARAQLAEDTKLRRAATATPVSAAGADGLAGAGGFDVSSLSPAAASALEGWTTDDGGVTWQRTQAAAAASARKAAVAPARKRRPVPSAAAMPPPTPAVVAAAATPAAAAPALTRRDMVRLALLPLCVYFALVGVWHHTKLYHAYAETLAADAAAGAPR